jgi:micrococcal nuclease
VGTPVTLEYDVERTDGYDRTLAGVHTADGVLINAEMARAGLAVPVVIGENDRFYPPVLEARDEAAAQHRGLFSTDVTCTLPAQVAAVSAAVAEGPTAAAQATGASIAELESSATAAAVALAAARALEDAFVRNPVGHVWEAFTSDERSRLLQDVRSSRATAERESAALGDAAAKAREEAARLAEEQRQARAAEEQRQARAAEEQRQAEERQQAREAERQREREAQRERDAAARRQAPAEPESSAGGNPYPGYTGPRCYAPGGKTWKPC